MTSATQQQFTTLVNELRDRIDVLPQLDRTDPPIHEGALNLAATEAIHTELGSLNQLLRSRVAITERIKVCFGDYELLSAFLDANNRSIRDIAGKIECNRDGRITSLNLSGYGYRQLDTLCEFSGLRSLTLDSPIAEDLHLALGIPTLTEFVLQNYQLTDPAIFAGLTQIQTLCFIECGIADVSALSSLVKLVRLDLSNNNISDFSPIAELPALSDLFIRGNPLRTLPTTGFPSVRKLDVSGSYIDSLEPSTMLEQLLVLDISGTRIADLGPLTRSANLNVLYMGNTAISDIRPLAELPNLEVLSLIHCPAIDVAQVARLRNLLSLVLEDTDEARVRFKRAAIGHCCVSYQ